MQRPLRSLCGSAAALLLLACMAGCGSTSSNPLTPEEEKLVGRWRLDVGSVSRDDFALTYYLGDDHDVINRTGGAFLQALRDVAAMRQVDLGQLPNLDAIEGGNVVWRGTWSLRGDSLRIHFAQLQVEAIGKLPVIGTVTVPVYQRSLVAAQQIDLAYTYSVEARQLVLHGAAASAGVADAAAAQHTAGLDPLAQQALSVAAGALGRAYVHSDANTWTYQRY